MDIGLLPSLSDYDLEDPQWTCVPMSRSVVLNHPSAYLLLFSSISLSILVLK